MPVPRFTRTNLMLLALVGVWGINFSVVKSVISGPDAPFTPLGFNALRFGAAAVTLLILLRRTGEPVPTSRRDWLAVCGLGVLGNLLYQVLFITGIDRTSPANSSLILATTPVIVAMIGVVLHLDRLTTPAWLGIAMSLAGIVVVVLGNGASTATDPGTSSLLGDVIIFGATAVWSIYTTLAAPLLERYSATMVTSLSLATAALPIILIALPDLNRLDWSRIPITGWSAVLFSGMFALAAGYATWNRGVKVIGGARTAVYSNLTPIVAAVVAWVARGDAITVYHLIGGAIVLTGIHLTRLGKRARLVALPAEE